LTGKAAWITGQRRGQSVTRGGLEKVEWDEANGLWKLNPLADWDSDRVVTYNVDHGVPLSALHAKGFPSVGCQPCTRAIKPGEDERAGRWWWENPEHKECGLHTHADAAATAARPKVAGIGSLRL
jgi:phosphoadenosine phosphosulfate reductase